MRVRKIKVKETAPTLVPGARNGNGQVLVGDTGWPSESRAGQRVYRMRCQTCGLEYGANGIDVDKRLCPGCGGGTKGERLRERGAGLFD